MRGSGSAAESASPTPIRPPNRELPRDGAPNAALVAPWQVALDLVFMRGKQTIFQKSAVATFNPGDRGKTLFWLMAPSDVPERRELQLSVSMRSRADPMPVRLQVWRKLELLPVR